MTSIIKLTAFSGVEDESPHCYLLQVDEFRFLLDCGWDEDFRMNMIDNIKKHVHQIDAVLLSFPDPLHIGALPYLVGKLGLNCPIYATIPIYKMGQMFMYDLYQSRHNTEDFTLFSLDDVDMAFDKIQTLKYSQTLSLKGKGHGLQITPLPAGHMIGGTMWKIVKDGEEEIVYAVDFNHKKERHLNGCMLDAINRPHLLITDAFNADYVQARRMQRDEQLMTNILQTMRNDGNVLVVTDTAGRVLELVQLLDQMWRNQESGLMAYSLALLNNVAYNVVEFAKSQVEWMSEKIMRAFEEQRSNPFQFKYVQLCHSLADLQSVPEPRVVLASVPDMQCGYSRELFLQWSSNAKNCIILTSRTQPGTLSRLLLNNPRSVTLDVRRRLRLDGPELEEHRRREKDRESEAARQKQEQAKREREVLESSESSDDESDVKPSTPIGSKNIKHDLMMKSEGRAKVGFFKQTKKTYPMFPFKEEKAKWDEYGEFVNAEDFNFAEPTAVEEEKMVVAYVRNIIASDWTNSGMPPGKWVGAYIFPIHINDLQTTLHAFKFIDEVTVIEEVDGVDTSLKDMYEPPTKCVSTMETIDIRASIHYIDFEGRSDGESIRKIITQIKPRQLILVRGSKATTDSLSEYCRSNIPQVNVFVPHLNELLDATTDSHIYQVKLKDSIVSALRFFKAKETEIAWIDAMLDMSQARADIDPLSSDADEHDEMSDVIPTLVPLAPNEIPSHAAVFINEPRLSEFKQLAVSRGIQAEMSGGVLICNNVVAVRRNEAGRLQLEGCVCDDYYKVRELLYEQFAIV